MKIQLNEKDNIVIAAIIGKIDLYNSNEINELFEKLISENKTNVIVNLENVPFMDSSAFVGFVNWSKKFQQISGKLIILNVTGFVAKVIEQNSMGALLEIYHNEQAALDSFSK
jgi:anti-sigma B factor antagonist